MLANTAKLTSIAEEYLVELRRLRDSGGASGEVSTYPALANQGAGHLTDRSMLSHVVRHNLSQRYGTAVHSRLDDLLAYL